MVCRYSDISLMKPANYHFTLVELLVATATLCILASLISPALRSAVEKSLRINELSYRCKLGSATYNYAEDNNGNFPARNRTTSLHQLVHPMEYDLIKSLVKSYIGSGKDITSNYTFCQSSLLNVRNPETPDYLYNESLSTHSTLTYYYIGKQSVGTWQADPFYISNANKTSGRYPLWSCVFLKIGTAGQVWMGHNAPIAELPPEGGSVVYIDGSGEWVPTFDWSYIWLTGPLRFYAPTPEGTSITGIKHPFPGP